MQDCIPAVRDILLGGDQGLQHFTAAGSAVWLASDSEAPLEQVLLDTHLVSRLSGIVCSCGAVVLSGCRNPPCGAPRGTGTPRSAAAQVDVAMGVEALAGQFPADGVPPHSRG
ncbi:unnamed protein product [Prorocentrum cordatum]|uniref:Uncharacterized protein n=1 Tax=Prorocentrum cordatum TaxID=2364126 RepID=A0ABN9WDS0_9DINO|nr:unnamed protein product [Polarella glacialis]